MKPSYPSVEQFAVLWSESETLREACERLSEYELMDGDEVAFWFLTLRLAGVRLRIFPELSLKSANSPVQV